jgi:hypothetical protein
MEQDPSRFLFAFLGIETALQSRTRFSFKCGFGNEGMNQISYSM